MMMMMMMMRQIISTSKRSFGRKVFIFVFVSCQPWLFFIQNGKSLFHNVLSNHCSSSFLLSWSRHFSEIKVLECVCAALTKTKIDSFSWSVQKNGLKSCCWARGGWAGWAVWGCQAEPPAKSWFMAGFGDRAVWKGFACCCSNGLRTGKG